MMANHNVLQTEALFSELHKLIRKKGLQKAILQIKSFNEGKPVDDVEIYEFIIKTVISIFGIKEWQLYNGNEKFISPDARRTSYYLIHKHLKYSHDSIGIQFGKKRNTITTAMSELTAIMTVKSAHAEYMRKHELCEERVIKFIKNLRNIKPNSAKKEKEKEKVQNT